MKKRQSRNFPGASLKECVNFIEKIDRELGGIPSDREQVGNAIGYNAAGGAGALKIGAIVHFGLLTNRNKKYALSESAETILRPIDEHEREQEIKRSFYQPKLYSEILAKFQDSKRIPTQLPNILNRQLGVSASSCKQAAKFFMESGQYAGIIDSNGHFIASEEEENHSVQPETHPEPTPKKNENKQKNIHDSSATSWTFPLAIGKTATVSISGNNVSEPDLDLLIKFLEISKTGLRVEKEVSDSE